MGHLKGEDGFLDDEHDHVLGHVCAFNAEPQVAQVNAARWCVWLLIRGEEVLVVELHRLSYLAVDFPHISFEGLSTDESHRLIQIIKPPVTSNY